MKKFLFFLLILLSILFFYPLLQFKRVENRNKLPYNYKKGVYHVHSLYSHDSTGRIEEIISAAKKNNLDFVILTDHGRPNLKSSYILKKYGRVLLIGASEFSLDCGHMTAIGFKRHNYKFAPEPQSAIDEVNEDGGITFIAHPYDTKIPWKNWHVKGFTGIELINTHSCLMNCSFLNTFFSFLYYQINPIFSLVFMGKSFSRKNFLKWDNINKKEKCFGILGLDAHGRFNILKFHLDFPKYKDMFGLFNVYVKIKGIYKNVEDEREEILMALKRGNFFSVVEGLGSANGFDTYLITKSGKIVEMGESVKESSGQIFFNLPFNFKTNIKVYRNGEIFKEITGKNGKLRLTVNEDGVYRSEIYIEGEKIPWITTNPFYLSVKYKDRLKDSHVKLLEPFKFNEDFFKVRKDGNSANSLNVDKRNKIYIMSYSLNSKGKDAIFGAAIYHKIEKDFSKFCGISFETKSDERMRYFFVIRYKNKCFRRSFLSKKGWTKVNIDFSSLVECGGNLNNKVNLKRSDVFLFCINNYIAYEGTSNKLYLRNFSLY